MSRRYQATARTAWVVWVLALALFFTTAVLLGANS